VDFLITHKAVFPVFLQNWISRLYDSIHATPREILYGTDWLAFAHLVIAVFFIGVHLDPVKNKFIVQAGMIACAGVFPLAFIMGPQRDIPFFHQLIDCSFGIIGFIPLYMMYKKINHLENETKHLSI
jgi:hypothetical protein